MIKMCLPSFRGLTNKTNADISKLLSDSRFKWYNPQPDILKHTYIDQAREYLIAGSQLEAPTIPNEITHILFIDDDINGFLGSDLITMYNLNVPIIGCLYHQKCDHNLFAAGGWSILGLPEPWDIKHIRTPLMPVDWIGMGFCLINIEVFQQVPRPWYYKPIVRWLGSDQKFRIDMLGEDVAFCRKASDFGFKSYAYNKILNHQES